MEELLDDIFWKSLHNAQSGTRSVVYNFVDRAMLDLLRKDIIGETLDARIAKIFDTKAAADKFSKKLFTSTSFVARIGTFLRHKTDINMQHKEYSSVFSLKDQTDAVETYSDVGKSPTSRSNSRDEELPLRNSSKPHLKLRHSTPESKDDKQHSNS